MVTDRKALSCYKTLMQFCTEQEACQNCIFRKFGAEKWDCYAEAVLYKGADVVEIEKNISAKKKNRGYI